MLGRRTRRLVALAASRGGRRRRGTANHRDVSGYINGASNVKYSEWNPAILAFNEAHVEAAEQGSHKIVVSDQPGCTVVNAVATGKTYRLEGGTVTVPVSVKSHFAGDATYFDRVLCAS